MPSEERGPVVSEALDLAILSGTLLVSGVGGGLLPMVQAQTHERMQTALSFSAGVMLGAAFIHLLPESLRLAAPVSVGYATVVGFLVLLLLERFVLVHACEASVCEVHAAPRTVGLAAFLGLAFHAVTDGVALGAAMSERRLAGLVSLAVVCHQVPASVALASLLLHDGHPRRRVLLFVAAVAAAIPAGAVLTLLAGSLVAGAHARGVALAFGAGTFLHLAVSDLLPELHRHGHDRVKLSLALVFGILLMAAVRAVWEW